MVRQKDCEINELRLRLQQTEGQSDMSNENLIAQMFELHSKYIQEIANLNSKIGQFMHQLDSEKGKYREQINTYKS